MPNATEKWGKWKRLCQNENFGTVSFFAQSPDFLKPRLCYKKQKKERVKTCSFFSVIRLGLEPRTPTLKVLCSTS